MNVKSVLGQLQASSPDVRDAGLKHVFRTYAGKPLPDELAAPIADLFRAGPPWSESLLLAVTGCPSPDLAPAVQELLEHGAPHERARALEYLPLWKDHVDVLARAQPVVEALSGEANAWPAFLASLVRVRIYGDACDAWERAATAILCADRAGPHASIRHRAEELLTLDEAAAINERLASRSAPPLAPQG